MESIIISKLKLSERFNASDIIRLVNLYKSFKIYDSILNSLLLKHPTKDSIISGLALELDVKFATKAVLFNWRETPGIPYWTNEIIPLAKEVKLEIDSSVYELWKLDSWHYEDHLIVGTYHFETSH